MLFSLRNDVVAIEYPIQHFISESLRNGDFPAWFNTWNMGFPLQSILSWGVYSTPQMAIGFFFESNLYVLHAEFIFFIIASGCCMYKLLNTHFIHDKKLSLLFACCYMLSGFTVGSSQWLLYITGMTFIPLLTYCLLALLKKPSAKYSMLFAVSFFLFFTNAHVYLTVVSTYILIFFLLIYFGNNFLTKDKNQQEIKKIFRQTFLTLLLTAILCAAPAYYSFEVISYLARSQPLGSDSVFFQSNYMHPEGLCSLLLPLSSIKISHFNTEGIVQNVYIGLFPLLLFPAAVLINIKYKNNSAWILLTASIFFLLISFGHLTPFRNWLNIVPGMSYFRHPGILRLFFIFSFILYIAVSFKKYSFSHLLRKDTPEGKIITITLLSLILVTVITFIFYSGNLPAFWKGSVYETIKNSNKKELLALSALIQFLFLIFIFLNSYKKQIRFSFLIISDLIINTLICTPFFSISTYSVRDANKIFASPTGFPVQQTSPQKVPGTFTDERNNSWFNINTFRKEISNNLSMPGPLIINNIGLFLSSDSVKQWLSDKEFVFINDTSVLTTDILLIESQRPGKVTLKTTLSASKEIILQQASFPGWKAYYDNKQIAISENKYPFVSVVAPSGSGKLIFKFEKPGIFYTAFILHIVVLLIVSYFLIKKIRLRLFFLS